MPTIHAISAFGPYIRCYEDEVVNGRVKVTPPRLPFEENHITYLEGQWDTDILTAAGFQMIQTIVRDIREHVPLTLPIIRPDNDEYSPYGAPVGLGARCA